MKIFSGKSLIALALLGAAAPAIAADLPDRKVAPVLTPAYSVPSPWQIRVRALGVLPDAQVNINQIPTANGKITNSVVPELDISYFFTKNIAAELILGVTPHKVTGTAGIAGLPIGSTTLLPPTLTLQYHFTDFGAFQPYVGAGVNYTMFLSTSPANSALGANTITALNIKSTPGLALQAGFDYMLNANWGLNVDVKKLWLRPDITATLSTTPGPVLTALTGNVRIDPWIVGVGVTYRFGGSSTVVAKY